MYIVKNRGFDPTTASLLFGGFFVIKTIVRPITGFLGDRLESTHPPLMVRSRTTDATWQPAADWLHAGVDDVSRQLVLKTHDSGVKYWLLPFPARNLEGGGEPLEEPLLGGLYTLDDLVLGFERPVLEGEQRQIGILRTRCDVL